MSPRVWRWSIVVAVVAVVATAILIALPYVVRHFAVQRVEAMTGRDVTIDDVDLNLFTRRIVFHDVRIASPGETPPLVTSPRIEARFQLLPFFSGRTVLEHVAIVEPVVSVVRGEQGTLNVEDVIERWQARPAGEPVQARLDALLVQDGRVTFLDRAVAPTREWTAKNLAVDARNITTVSDAAAGELSAAFEAAGGTATVDVSNLRVRPLAARARIVLEGIDVAPFQAYQPADAPVIVTGGQLTTTIALEYEADGPLRVDGRGTLREVVLRRPAQDPDFVTIPVATLIVDEVTWANGALAVRDAVVRAEHATVFDATAARPRALDIRDIEAAFHDAPVDGPAGRLTVSAGLPGDGSLQASGTGTLFPPAGEIDLEVRGLDAALAQMWIPLDAVMTPTAGELAATLALRFGQGVLHADGRVWASDLAVVREGQPTPLVRDDRVEVTVTGLVVDDRGTGFERLRLVASPTIALRDPSSALALQELVVSAAGGRFPGEQPAQVEARIVMPHGGRITATGQAQVAAPSVTLDVVVEDVDAMLAAPYVPPQAPVTIQNGRLDARLDVAWRDGLAVDAQATVRALAIQWDRQDAPLVEHALLRLEIADLEWRGGALSLARVTLTGSPTIVDATASPPQRFDVQRLRLTATGVTWPGRAPIKVEGLAETADGGTATLNGTFDIATLATDVRLDFGGVDVTRARGYIPETAPITVEGGQAQGTVRLQHAKGTVKVDAEGALRDLAITLTTGPVVPITDDRVTFMIENLLIKDGGGLALGRAVVDGSPRIAADDGDTPAFPLHAELRGFASPEGRPAGFTITAKPGDGHIQITGAFDLADRAINASIRAENAAIAPFAPLIPVDAPVGGRVDATLDATLRPAAEAPFTLRGDLTVHALRVGPEDTAPVMVDAVRVHTLAIEGRSLDIGRIVLEKPSVLVERAQDGSFPLRAMLTPNGAGSASPPEAPPERPRGSAPSAAAAETKRPTAEDEALPWRVDVDEMRIAGGSIRFIDRTTRPFYSEEITRLETTIRDLSNVGQSTAGLTIQGIVGADAALELNGEIAPFAEPFFLEVSGTLRDFSVPRTNPLLERFLDWIANRGELTTQVHYRIVGTELTATNELVVRRLDVEKTRDGDRTERLVGLPLGLVVSLLKDASGTIKFTLPVSGELSSPQFSFGDAIKSALRNVIGRLVTSPFRAIGSVFRKGKDGEIDDLRVDPVTFPAGSAVLTPAAAGHLQRVADFLRASPYIRLALEPVVTEQDLVVLRSAEVTARIQRVQREQGIEFGEAAGQVWRAGMPAGAEPPDDPQGIVRVLAQREPPPTEAARQLAERRASVTRTHLVEDAGIARDRLVSSPGAPPIGAEGDGRVSFALEPAS